MVRSLFGRRESDTGPRLPAEKKPESRLLVIIQFHGSTRVLENERFKHQRGRHFETEAVELFKNSFGWPPPVKASSSKFFAHAGVEWHIVTIPLRVCLLAYIPEMGESVEASGAKLKSIQEHSLFEAFLKSFV